MVEVRAMPKALWNELAQRAKPVVQFAQQHQPKTVAGWLAVACAAGVACSALSVMLIIWMFVLACVAVVSVGTGMVLGFFFCCWLCFTAWAAAAFALAAGSCAAGAFAVQLWLTALAAVWRRVAPGAGKLALSAERVAMAPFRPSEAAHRAATTFPTAPASAVTAESSPNAPLPEAAARAASGEELAGDNVLAPGALAAAAAASTPAAPTDAVPSAAAAAAAPGGALLHELHAAVGDFQLSRQELEQLAALVRQESQQRSVLAGKGGVLPAAAAAHGGEQRQQVPHAAYLPVPVAAA